MRKWIGLDMGFIVKHNLDKSEMLLFAYLHDTRGLTRWISHAGSIWYVVSRLELIENVPFITDKPDTMYRLIKRLESKGLILLSKMYGSEFFTLTDSGEEWGMDSKFKKTGRTSDKNPTDKLDENPNGSDIDPSGSDGNPNGSDIFPKTLYSIGSKEEKEEGKDVKRGKPLSSVQSFLDGLPEAERLICERYIKHRREIKNVVHTGNVLKGFLRDLKVKTDNPELWPALMDILEEKQWVSIEHVKLEKIPSTEPIPLGYRLAAMRCGAKTDDEIRKIVPKFEGLNPDMVGLWFRINQVIPDSENLKRIPDWLRTMKQDIKVLRKAYAKEGAEGVKAILEKSIEWTKTKL